MKYLIFFFFYLIVFTQPGKLSNLRIAHTSLLIHSLGMVPFKDGFFTTNAKQLNCNEEYDRCDEPDPELHAIVAALSAGPIAPSDAITMMNRCTFLFIL